MTSPSGRGRIEIPNLDDRTWQDLVDEMTALIPSYAPQWTDRTPSDLGMTLIELFAALGENVIYRLNRVPDKSYLALLDLLGVTREPAIPAQTYLTFTTGAGVVKVPAGTQAQTTTTEDETPVIFETDEAVSVLPTVLKAALVVGPYAAGATASTYVNLSAVLIGPPTSDYLLVVPPGQTIRLLLGFDAAVTQEMSIGLQLFHPVTEEAQVDTGFSCSVGSAEPFAWAELTGVVDGTDGLRRDGTVRLTPPGTWAAQRAAGPENTRPWKTVTPRSAEEGVRDPLFWVGLRITNPTSTGSPLAARIDRLLFNAASARTALSIPVPEVLGRSTGEPFQTFELAHRPLFRRPGAAAPFDHLVVQVDSEEWSLVEDIPPGPGKVYRVDPVLGQIRFGGDRPGVRVGEEAHGSVPPAGSEVRAARYRYVDRGEAGNLRPSQVTVSGSTRSGAFPAGVTVTNLGPGRNGVDEQSVEETVRRAPEKLATRDRAVTVDDYELLVHNCDPAIRIRRCLSPRGQTADLAGTWKRGDPWTFAGILRVPGSVNVIVVPGEDPDIARPEPTREQLRAVRAYLESRRDLTAQLAVYGPRYLPVVVKCDIALWPEARDLGVVPADVEAETLAAVRRFLHPTCGGPTGTGWQIGQPVLTSDVFAALSPPEDVGYVALLQVKPDTPLYHFPPLNPTGTAGNYEPERERPIRLDPFGPSVRLADYELVCAADRHEISAKAT